MRILVLLLLALVSGCGRTHALQDVSLRLSFEGGGLCSGTAVAKDTILSAAHCFDKKRLVAINGQPAYAMRIIRDGNDHVLVKVTRAFKHWARIGRNPAQGLHVTFIGNPLGLANAYREAYVVAVESDQILYDGNSAPGDSGAGLMAGGKVVGVVTGTKFWRGTDGQQFSLLWSMPLAFTPEPYAEMV